MNLPWLEKYRPQSLTEIVGNKDIITSLDILSEKGNLPNLLIAGPPGTGKTTSIICLAKSLLKDNYKNAVLELNASDDRGIDIIRNKIKMFATIKVNLPPNKHKIIIFDESDNMTTSAQNSLRRIIELNSKTTRFVFSCNISSKIIEAIQSRCVILRYSKLSNSEINYRLVSILKSENIETYNNKGLEAIIFASNGDMRNAINLLQATYSGFNNINEDNVYKVADIPQPIILKSLIGDCIKSDIAKAIQITEGLISKGYSTVDIIVNLFRVIKGYSMKEELQLEFIKEIGFTHMRMSKGIDSPLQLLGLMGKLCRIAKNF